VAQNNISDMIRRSLYNPNIAPDEGGGITGGGETIPNTPLLIDKPVTDIEFGFVKEGSTILLAGIIGRGLAAGSDSDILGNFDFINTSNLNFPAFCVNDILKVSNAFALICSNHGLIEYDVTSGKSLVRTTSYGLNSYTVKRIIPVLTSLNKPGGYISGTSKGICFSHNGARWLNVDQVFTDMITCFHSSQSLDTSAKHIFIGTSKGLYYFDAASYIEEEKEKVIRLDGIMTVTPNRYINAIAYNSVTDTLYVATDNGLLRVNDITAYMNAKNYSEEPPNYKVFNSNHGLSSTLCFDLALMPNQKLVIATANGLTITQDFINFSYIAKKTPENGYEGLESYMCNRLIRRNAVSVTVLHPIGLTEGITI
jgi:ligand-binding sensor domain-containing protein